MARPTKPTTGDHAVLAQLAARKAEAERLAKVEHDRLTAAAKRYAAGTAKVEKGERIVAEGRQDQDAALAEMTTGGPTAAEVASMFGLAARTVTEAVRRHQERAAASKRKAQPTAAPTASDTGGPSVEHEEPAEELRSVS